MKATLQFQCTACNKVHRYPDHAEECCPPEIRDVWICDICGDVYEEKKEAEECCVKKHNPKIYCPKCMRFPKYEMDYE